MSKRDFNKWLATFRSSISDYGYYVDFPKIFRNVDKVKVELNILNSLIGSKDIESEFKSLLARYPEVMKCIPLLLAVRSNEIYAMDEDGTYLYQFNKVNYSIDQYVVFMRKTGLFDLLQKHIISNIIDYATGVETGLDSNGRKNRGGHLMENLVERFIVKAGFKRDLNYFKEMYIHEIIDKWNIDLSAISAEGTSTKRWDFVVKAPLAVYVIETNFYTSGGSKLNETARSYKMIAEESKSISGFKFVWITDGGGWNSARRNLEETFDVLTDLYNISDMEDNVFGKIFV